MRLSAKKMAAVAADASAGVLPPRYPWDAADKEGWSVAHIYQAAGSLPSDFTRWEISDIWGSSIAHGAAMVGELPADFNMWELTDSDGVTVRGIYLRRERFHKYFTSLLNNS